MLTISEIHSLIGEDNTTVRKQMARKGQMYYDGDHDIRNYRLFYYNADGVLTEDTTRSNVKIPHPFFTELVDQAVQYIMSGQEGIIRSDIPELQEELDARFNENEDFMAELSDTITGSMVKGFDYMYAYRNKDNRLTFMNADGSGVVEVRKEYADDGCEYVIYWYIDRIDKGHTVIKRIQVWDAAQTYYYVQQGGGEIVPDKSEPINPRPHTLYTKGNDDKTYYEGFGFIPFFRLDNNRKQFSSLKTIKGLIDDYDLMASSLSNNLIDFDTPLYAIKGFEGDNLDELQKNLRTKKIVGLGEDGGVDVKTVDVPYQARLTKLELDEKNIYRFGMGLNTAGLKDTNATTNIAIKAAYSLLDLKCTKLETRLRQFLRKIIAVVLDDINRENESDYRQQDVYIRFEHEVMSNAQENAQIALTEAQEQQARINTLLSLAELLDDETLMQSICEALDIDYEDVKDKLPKGEERDTQNAKQTIGFVLTEEDTGEQTSEGSNTEPA